MAISERQLNRATIHRQLLSQRTPARPGEVLRQVLCLQAQDPAGPYLALWNRIVDFDAGELDAAFAAGSVVKASLLRLTLHAVHAQDWPWIHAAMLTSLRGSRLTDPRFLGTGLTAVEADRLLTEVAPFVATPRTSTEIKQFLDERLGRTEPRLWWALKMYAPFHHAPTGGAWLFGTESSFVAAHTPAGPPDPTECASRLLRRYLAAYGPAELRDFAQFTMLRQPVARQAEADLGEQLQVLEGPNGHRLLDLATAELPDEDLPTPPRLLGMWDEALLAYVDRSRVLPDRYRPAVIQRNGDVLPSLLIDGYVAGNWRQVNHGIEVRAFHRLDRATWAAVGDEAAGLAALLAGRGASAGRRFDHWWEKSPAVSAESKTFPS